MINPVEHEIPTQSRKYRRTPKYGTSHCITVTMLSLESFLCWFTRIIWWMKIYSALGKLCYIVRNCGKCSSVENFPGGLSSKYRNYFLSKIIDPAWLFENSVLAHMKLKRIWENYELLIYNSIINAIIFRAPSSNTFHG